MDGALFYIKSRVISFFCLSLTPRDPESEISEYVAMELGMGTNVHTTLCKSNETISPWRPVYNTPGISICLIQLQRSSTGTAPVVVLSHEMPTELPTKQTVSKILVGKLLPTEIFATDYQRTMGSLTSLICPICQQMFRC